MVIVGQAMEKYEYFGDHPILAERKPIISAFVTLMDQLNDKEIDPTKVFLVIGRHSNNRISITALMKKSLWEEKECRLK